MLIKLENNKFKYKGLKTRMKKKEKIYLIKWLFKIRKFYNIMKDYDSK